MPKYSLYRCRDCGTVFHAQPKMVEKFGIYCIRCSSSNVATAGRRTSRKGVK